MSDSKTTTVNTGGSLFGVLGLILVILKLAGVQPVADWSWWLVTLPFWFGLAVVLVFLVVMGVVAAIIFAGKALLGR